MVRLYTKPACPLCDEARDLLEDLADEFVFDLDVADITSDPAWFARFRAVIPVVEVPGVGQVNAPLDRSRVHRFLAAAGVPRRQRPFRWRWDRT